MQTIKKGKKCVNLYWPLDKISRSATKVRSCLRFGGRPTVKPTKSELVQGLFGQGIFRRFKVDFKNQCQIQFQKAKKGLRVKFGGFWKILGFDHCLQPPKGDGRRRLMEGISQNLNFANEHRSGIKQRKREEKERKVAKMNFFLGFWVL